MAISRITDKNFSIFSIICSSTTYCVVLDCYNKNQQMGGQINMSTDKINRVLLLFHKLIKGEHIHKADFAETHNVSERSVERDIEDIRIFLSEIHASSKLVFDKPENVYYLSSQNGSKLNSIENVVLLKIILGTRALIKEEIEMVVKSLRLNLSPQDRKEILRSIQNEIDNYISPLHGKPLLATLNKLNKVIINRQAIKITYAKDNGEEYERVLLPLAFVFSDFYFYLVAFIDGKDYKYLAFFRVDRIKDIVVLHKKVTDEVIQKYDTGKMRNYLRLMYGGKLSTIKIKCRNSAVTTFQNIVPDHWLIKNDDDYKIFGAKIFDRGFVRWVLSQGAAIEILEPENLRQIVVDEIQKMSELYNV